MCALLHTYFMLWIALRLMHYWIGIVLLAAAAVSYSKPIVVVVASRLLGVQEDISQSV